MEDETTLEREKQIPEGQTGVLYTIGWAIRWSW